MIAYQQTDTPAVFTGAGMTGQPANSTTVNRLCIGTPGSVVTPLTLDAHASSVYAMSFDIPIPQYTLWNAGSWLIRLNVRLANPSITWNGAYVFRLNSAGTSQGLFGANLRFASVFGTSGVKSIAVPTAAQYLRSYGDRVLIVLTFVNQGTLPPQNLVVTNGTPQPCSFVMDQLIDSPFSLGN